MNASIFRILSIKENTYNATTSDGKGFIINLNDLKEMVVWTDNHTEMPFHLYVGSNVPNTIKFYGTYTRWGDTYTGGVSSLFNYLDYIDVDPGNSYFYPNSKGTNCIINNNNELLLGSTNSIIPSGVTKIKSCAFTSNDMTSITIPSTVTEIEDYAFYYSSSLNEINFEGTIAEWGNITLGENDWRDSSKITTVTCSNGVVTL